MMQMIQLRQPAAERLFRFAPNCLQDSVPSRWELNLIQIIWIQSFDEADLLKQFREGRMHLPIPNGWALLSEQPSADDCRKLRL